MNWEGGEYEPRQERAERMKERILDAALELFSEQGYHGTNTKEVAARAGVATGSVYRYFADKKALFLAVMKRMEEHLRGRIFGFGRTLAESGDSPRQMLERMVTFSLEAHREHRGMHREILVMTMLDPDVATLVAEREARVRRELMEFLAATPGLRAQDDPEAAAEMMHLAVEEVAHRAVIFESPLGKGLTRALVDMLAAWLIPGGDDRGRGRSAEESVQ